MAILVLCVGRATPPHAVLYLHMLLSKQSNSVIHKEGFQPYKMSVSLFKFQKVPVQNMNGC